ncbi:MAG TPA: hypothetical protein VIL42_08700 [Sphingomicrobium sp.]|jgi:hypothetical protein
MRKLTLAALLAAAALSACTEARIAVPSDVAAGTQQLALTGIGGWQDGSFRLGASEGRFSRRAEQARIFDIFVRNRGMATFEASGPELNGRAGATCGFREGEFDAGLAVLPAGRLTYNCRFDGGGELFLAEVPYGTGLLAGRSRAGEIRIGSERVAIEAIHNAAGGSLPAGTPLGYSFSVGGRQIGAVNLNGAKTVYAPATPGAERDAVLLGSLALALFWDPGA